jgi:xanthine dehydrogenase/oxidase
LCNVALVGFSWKELVNAAYVDRVDLSAHGFYVTPDITGFGGNRPFNYFCFVSARTIITHTPAE